MSEQEPLVKGGVLEGIRYGAANGPRLPSHATFTTTCPTFVEKDAIIIGIASPSFRGSDPVEGDGWFLSDFYAFNYLFKGLGLEQFWISAVDPHKFVDAQSPRGRLLHGNPYQPRKVVLSKELLEKEEITLPLICPRPKLQSTFLELVKVKSEEAANQDVPLLLLVFCHGRDRTLLLGGSERKGLTPSELDAAIHPRCRVTMINTACYSGGWVVSVPGGVSLNATAMIAADRANESNSWVKSSSIGRYCGSQFVSTVIERLVSKASPLLKEPAADGDLTPLNPEGIDPEDETFNSFCQTVLKTSTDVSRLCNDETFTFSAQDDKWNWAWQMRSGIPIEGLRARWEALQTYEPQILENDPDDPYPDWHQMDPSPLNPKMATASGSVRTGGSSPMEDFALAEARKNAIAMAKAFLDTCPGDWHGGWAIKTLAPLNRLIDGKEPDGVNPIAMMRFRWEAARVADNLVARFQLPVPNGQYCLMWERKSSSAIEQQSLVPNYGRNYYPAFHFISHSPLQPEPLNPLQGPPFTRIAHYLGTAVALAGLSIEEQAELLRKMEESVQEECEAWVKPVVQLAGQNRSVLKRAREHFKDILGNPRIRLRSLSPRKRVSTSSTPRRGRSESQASSVNPENVIESSPMRSPVLPRRSTDASRGSFDLRRSFDPPSR